MKRAATSAFAQIIVTALQSRPPVKPAKAKAKPIAAAKPRAEAPPSKLGFAHLLPGAKPAAEAHVRLPFTTDMRRQDRGAAAHAQTDAEGAQARVDFMVRASAKHHVRNVDSDEPEPLDDRQARASADFILKAANKARGRV